MTLIALLIACAGTPEDPATTAVLEPSAAAAPAPAHTEPAPPTATADEAGWSHFGAPFTLTEVVAAAAVLDTPDKYVDQTVLVEGEVADVCQKAGCWMVITDSTRTMRVLMKDHEFAVDKQGAGATCQIEGIIEAKKIDPETVAHFEGESAKPEAMPEKQVQGETVYQFVATGVRMKKGA